MSDANGKLSKDHEAALDYYRAHLRGSGMPAIEMRGFYDLYPGTDDADCEYRWPNAWPDVQSPGVYFIFDVNMQVLYIGKASMNNPLGSRLGTYFKFGPNKSCVVQKREYWKGVPRFVSVIAMKPEFRFQAPALEEYLIGKLQPIDNDVGISNR